MKKANLFLMVIVAIALFSCGDSGNKQTKHFDPLAKVVDYKSKLKDINTGVLISEITTLSVIDDYLILHDLKPSLGYAMHILNKNSFDTVAKAVFNGAGPNEVSTVGEISLDYKGKNIWVPDLAKQVIWQFPLDSMVKNNSFHPNKSIKFNQEMFMYTFDFIDNDNVIGKAIALQPDHSMAFAIAKLQLSTNKIAKFGHNNPELKAEKTEFNFALSLQNKVYANAYVREDLLTICNLDGSLRCNVYGKQWKNSKKGKSYFEDIDFIGNKIIAAYLGKMQVADASTLEINYPTKLLVFDIDGNYKQTIDVGYGIISFTTDAANNRIILYLDGRDKALAYIDLKALTS